MNIPDYPIEKIVDGKIEIINGGFTVFLFDLAYFSIKCFLFLSIGWCVLWAWSTAFVDQVNKHMDPTCIAELSGLFGK